MPPHYALVVFATVFLAELGDKTQLATLLFATERAHHPVVVFIAASAALIVSSAIAVLLGSLAQQYLKAIPLKLIAGIGFIAIGALTVRDHFVS